MHMPRSLQCSIILFFQIVLVGCSDGQDAPASVVVTAQQLCGEAVFTAAASVTDPAIEEISGIVASRAQPDVYWVHPDSGNAAEIFAVNGKGETLNRYRLQGVNNTDWEDIAIAVDESGVSRLYIGDIGDNAKTRDHVTVYQLREPTVTGNGNAVELNEVTAHHYTYPDVAHNSEGLFIDERVNRLYLVTKETDVLSQTSEGPAGVYSAPIQTAAGSTEVMRYEASIDFAVLDSAGHDAYREQLGITEASLPTAADFNPVTGVVGIRTYGSLWLWQVGESQDVAEALQSAPCEAPSRLELIGEALGFTVDGNGYVTVGELQSALAVFTRD
jgi:hypothetical protein